MELHHRLSAFAPDSEISAVNRNAGIAKGYAAGEVRNILYEYGVQEAAINLGGDCSQRYNAGCTLQAG